MATRWYLEANRDELMQVSGIFSRPQSRPSTMLPIHAPSRSPFLNGVGQRIANDKPMANEDLAATGFWPLRASSSRPASDITSEAFKTRFASSPTCRAFPKTAVSLDSTGSLMRRSSPEHRELFMEWGRNGGCPGSATVVEPTMRPMTGTRSSPPWNHAVGLTQWVGLSRTAQHSACPLLVRPRETEARATLGAGACCLLTPRLLRARVRFADPSHGRPMAMNRTSLAVIERAQERTAPSCGGRSQHICPEGVMIGCHYP
jgi:hypothetical protein